MLRYRFSRGVMLGLALALVSVLVGCGDADRTEAPSPETPVAPSGPVDLDGTEWTLLELNGGSLLPATNVTLSFEEGNAGGFAGCNAYGASYEVGRGSALSIAMLEQTLQACLEPEGVMEQEDAYLAALQATAAYRVIGDRLEIEDGTGLVVLIYTRKVAVAMDPGDLVGAVWQLVSLDGAGPVEGSAITLGFDGGGQAGGLAGCREYTATYEASGDKISFPMISMSGDEACLVDEALYYQEGAYTDALTWATNFRLDGGRLEIETARGEVLVFELVETQPVLGPEQAVTGAPAGRTGQDACAGYLDLVASAGGGERSAVDTSYHCGGVHVDSTGQPSGSPPLSVPADAPLRLEFGADSQPESVLVRIYSGTGVSASFFRWPEELPGSTEPVAVFAVTGPGYEIHPQMPPGEYSMVIRAVWKGAIEIFYAFGFRID